MAQKKEKLALYLSPEKKAELERRYGEDGSRSQTEFVERALDFYLDYLSMGARNRVLPREIRSVIDGRIGLFEDHMAKLLYKLSVVTDMQNSILASAYELPEEYLRKLRAESVKRVNRTNGVLSLEQGMRSPGDSEYESEDEAWQS